MSCPACETLVGARQMSLRERMFGTGESFEYVECAECGTLRIGEVPLHMGRFYPPDYYSFSPPTEARGLRGRLRVSRARYVATGHGMLGRVLDLLRPTESLREIGRVRPPTDARILDVGSGGGGVLQQLSEIGFTHLEGVDPFIDADLHLGNVRIHKSTIAEIQGRFDLITFIHSLEHVSNPLTDLRHAALLLAEGGTVVVRMPVAGAFAWETYGTDWVQLDPPRHLAIFSERGARALAERAGLSVIEVRYDSTAFQFWGSEQARRGIPLRSPLSYAVDPTRSSFTPAEIRHWAQRARELNDANQGDQAAYYLQLRSPPP